MERFSKSVANLESYLEEVMKYWNDDVGKSYHMINDSIIDLVSEIINSYCNANEACNLLHSEYSDGDIDNKIYRYSSELSSIANG